MLVVFAEFVRSDGHDLAPDVSDDDPSIEVCSGLVVAPCNEAGQDLRDLAEPDRGLWPEVEVLERQFVTARGVTEDHRSASPISRTLPRGIHFFGAPVGVAVVVLRPLDRLRWGSEAGSASAAESRWMVDQRASSRPFSMREMSAWGTPVRFDSSACVQPSSARRSRIESPGCESSASVDQEVMPQVYVGKHIVSSVFRRECRRYLHNVP